MKLVFLPVNQAWVVMFGDQIIDIGDTGRRFWSNLGDLRFELRALGLKIVGRDIVVA